MSSPCPVRLTLIISKRVFLCASLLPVSGYSGGNLEKTAASYAFSVVIITVFTPSGVGELATLSSS